MLRSGILPVDEALGVIGAQWILLSLLICDKTLVATQLSNRINITYYHLHRLWHSIFS